MSAFKDGTWAQRYTKLGDEAEGMFELYAKDVLDKGFVRTGLDRPPLALYMLPTRERYRPDYLMSDCYVEVQGLGRDQTFKLKLDKWNCLCFWNGIHPVRIYVWDSHKKRECMFDLFEIERLLGEGRGNIAAFPEKKPYFALPADDVFEAGSE